MSTQPLTTDGSGPQCVTTQEVEARICKRCGESIPEGLREGTKYCSRACQHNIARDMDAELTKELKTVAKQIVFKYLHRDCYFAFDGRYEGPINKSVTFVEVLKKDKGYRPMPIDVHIDPAPAKFQQVTPEDVDWGRSQGSYKHGLVQPRTNYCAHCIDMVVDAARNKVRVTKGVYLPIEHECAAVRVYNLHGQLLEVKTI